MGNYSAYGNGRIKYIDNPDIDLMIKYSKTLGDNEREALFTPLKFKRVHVYPAEVFATAGDLVLLHDGNETCYGLFLGYTPDKVTGRYSIICRLDFGSAFNESRSRARKERLLASMEHRLLMARRIKQYTEQSQDDAEMLKLLEEYRDIEFSSSQPV